MVLNRHSMQCVCQWRPRVSLQIRSSLFRIDFRYCSTRSNLFAVLCPGKRAGGACLLNKRAPSLPTYMGCISHKTVPHTMHLWRGLFFNTLYLLLLSRKEMHLVKKGNVGKHEWIENLTIRKVSFSRNFHGALFCLKAPWTVGIGMGRWVI